MSASQFLLNNHKLKFKKKTKTGRLNIVISKHYVSATASSACFGYVLLCVHCLCETRLYRTGDPVGLATAWEQLALASQPVSTETQDHALCLPLNSSPVWLSRTWFHFFQWGTLCFLNKTPLFSSAAFRHTFLFAVLNSAGFRRHSVASTLANLAAST